MSTLDEMEMPTLTFDPAPVPEEKAPVVPVQEEKAELDDSMLNDKERQMVESFAKQIDLHNTNGILQYGAGTQKKMADFSEKALENHQTQLMKDVAMLDHMYEQNLLYFKELSMYILAGKKKLEEVKTTELTQLMAKAQASGQPEDAQAVKDLTGLCDRFEKKIHDLELTRMISIQTAPQIRLVQNSDTMMVEKIQTTVVNTIPLWKSQMVLALGVEHASQAAQAQRQVTDMTNDLLRKNAEVLKVASVEAAKESERGIVDLETLQNTNASLISTLDEVMQIQADGRMKRQAAEVELRKMEDELKNKLLEIR